MRTRLTITLKKQLLDKLDASIDGVKIRNRSHAIEYFLDKTFQGGQTQAVILAGGQGTRMRPYTYELPKPMLLVKKKPLLEYSIALLRSADIKDIILCIGKLGEKIKEYFGDGKRFGVRITYVEEKTQLGTGGALWGARAFLTSPTFLLFYGDVLTGIDVRELISFHQQTKATATLALTSVKDASRFGQIALKGKTVTAFQNAIRSKTHEFSNLINAGIYVMNKDVFKYMGKEEKFSLEDVLGVLVEKRLVNGYVFDEAWFDVGTPEDYERALKS